MMKPAFSSTAYRDWEANEVKMSTRDAVRHFAIKFLPPPIKQIHWRIKWASQTNAFRHAPAQILMRTATWTALELIRQDLYFILDEFRFATPRNNMTGLFAYVERDFDDKMFSYIRTNIPSDGVFCDVGANIGIYTLRVAKIVGSKGKVIAFEAHPKTFTYLERNISYNNPSNIICISAAVGAKSGTAYLKWDLENAGATHVTSEGLEAAKVPMVTLDEELPKRGIDILDYLKIDVEGYELDVLQGARRIIQNSPRLSIQTEVDYNHLRRYRRSGADLKDFMSIFGFEPWQIGSTGELVTKGLPEDFGDVIWVR